MIATRYETVGDYGDRLTRETGAEHGPAAVATARVSPAVLQMERASQIRRQDLSHEGRLEEKLARVGVSVAEAARLAGTRVALGF